MSDTHPVEGGCACGAIRYQCTTEPLFVFQCRCRDCQRATGGAFATNVWFAADAISFSKEPKNYVVEAATGNRVYHFFCPDCGSPLGMRSDGFSDFRGVRAASLDDASGLEPIANVWKSNGYPWEHIDADLFGSDTQPDLDHFGEFLEEAMRHAKR